MRILQVITGLSPAGAERVVCELSKGLRARGHEVLVVSLMPPPAEAAIVEELRSAGVEVRFLGVSKTAPWRIRGLRGIVGEFRPDALHAHLIHANLASRLLPSRLRRDFKLVNTVHIAERRPGKGWHFFLDGKTFARCDVQTCVSKAVRDFHSVKIGVSPESMPVVYNGLPAPERLSAERIRGLRVEWGVADCARVIGSVGRLDWQKGYDIFFERLADIAGIVPEGEKWGVVVLGEGPERGRLENIVNGFSGDLPFTVRLPGFRSDAADCAGAFDLFAMPSRYEGFGLTLVEAMGHGAPVLVSGVDSLPELLEGYSNGAIVDFADPVELSAKVAEFLARGTVEPATRFSVDEMVDGYLELYGRVC
jgi:glycosyltransferase involved in cell wall biosynthesis